MAQLHQSWGKNILKLLITGNFKGFLKLLSSDNYLENGDNFLAIQVRFSSCSNLQPCVSINLN